MVQTWGFGSVFQAAIRLRMLGAGALGLLAEFIVPVLGALAAASLVLYFIGALWAHFRVGDYALGPWFVFFCLPAAALAVNLAYAAATGKPVASGELRSCGDAPSRSSRSRTERQRVDGPAPH
ncbi:DoxX family protein [Streptomyces sp. NPDC006283]|uniref:DoxX family protein n=1 Tax=Streptomyces sp. NPDC006283 TaxID=3156741 RepID=UPI0033AEF357